MDLMGIVGTSNDLHIAISLGRCSPCMITVVATGYKIPVGGAFDWVSGANYFGEIVEWMGFAIAAWSLPAAAFVIFNFCNLAPRAWHHHLWYKQRFKEYPADRAAILPLLW